MATSKGLNNSFKLNKIYVITQAAFGAKGDGVTNDLTAFKTALAAMPNGGRLIVPRGRYKLTLASDSDSLLLPNDFKLEMEEDAILEWDYLGSPLLVAAEKENILIEGGMFEWDGTLAEVAGSPSSTRFGWTGSFAANRDYCAHILSLGSTGVRVRHTGCRKKGDNPSAATDSYVIFVGNYSNEDGTTRVADNEVVDCKIDDVVQGALVIGQDNFRFEKITQRRYPGDHPIGGGLNGHLLYLSDPIDLPTRGLQVRDIVDHGTCIGTATGRNDSAIQVKGAIAPIITGVHSRRPGGIFSLFGFQGGHVSDSSWRPETAETNGMGSGTSNGIGLEDAILQGLSFYLPTDTNKAAWNLFNMDRSRLSALISAAHTSTSVASAIFTTCVDNRIVVDYLARNTTSVQPGNFTTNSHRNRLDVYPMGQNQAVRPFTATGCLNNVVRIHEKPLDAWTNNTWWTTESDSPALGYEGIKKSKAYRVTNPGADPSTTIQLPREGTWIGTITYVDTTTNQLLGGLYKIVWDAGTLQFAERIGPQWSKGSAAPTAMSVSVSATGVVTVSANAASFGWDIVYDLQNFGNLRYADY